MFLFSGTGDSEEKLQVLPTAPLVTSIDALPLSYRRLVGAKAIELGLCDKNVLKID